MISAMRIEWKWKHILIGKTYLDAAYRRIYANEHISPTFITFLDNPDLQFSCQTSVMSPTPEEYNTVWELSINLGNYLLRDKSWNATEFQSPHKQLLKEEEYQPEKDQLVQADAQAFDTKAKEY